VSNHPPQQGTHQHHAKNHHQDDTCDVHQSNIQRNWRLIAHVHGISGFHCLATAFRESKLAFDKIMRQSWGYEIPAANADMGTSE